MAYANIKRPNRRSQFEIGNPSTKGNLSSRNSKAAQNFVLTPKERAIIEAERKRKAAERESGWDSRFYVPPPEMNQKFRLRGDSRNQPDRFQAATPSASEYKAYVRGGVPPSRSRKKAPMKVPPKQMLKPLRPEEQPAMPNLSGADEATTFQRQLAALQVDAVRAVGYRESLLMQLNAVVLNWPRQADHPTKLPTMSTGDRLRVQRLSISALPQAARMMKNLALELREAGLRCVEKIVAWVLASNPNASEPAPFFWNGQDYLLKMFSDLDFVAKSIGDEATKIGNFAFGNPLLLSPDELGGKGVRAVLGRTNAASVVILDVVRRHQAKIAEEEAMRRQEQLVQQQKLAVAEPESISLDDFFQEPPKITKTPEPQTTDRKDKDLQSTLKARTEVAIDVYLKESRQGTATQNRSPRGGRFSLNSPTGKAGFSPNSSVQKSQPPAAKDAPSPKNFDSTRMSTSRSSRSLKSSQQHSPRKDNIKTPKDGSRESFDKSLKSGSNKSSEENGKEIVIQEHQPLQKLTSSSTAPSPPKSSSISSHGMKDTPAESPHDRSTSSGASDEKTEMEQENETQAEYSSSRSNPIPVGTMVEAIFDEEYWPGRVTETQLNSDGSYVYTVLFDDGDIRDDVSESEIKVVKPENLSLESSSAVESDEKPETSRTEYSEFEEESNETSGRYAEADKMKMSNQLEEQFAEEAAEEEQRRAAEEAAHQEALRISQEAENQRIAEEERRAAEAENLERQNNAAVSIQCLARKRQAQEKVGHQRQAKKAQIQQQQEKAALKIQCLARQKQAREKVSKKRLERRTSNESEPQEPSIEESYGEEDFEDDFEDDNEASTGSVRKKSLRKASSPRVSPRKDGALLNTSRDPLKDFNILKMLGEGAYGEVYLAVQHSKGGAEVALKKFKNQGDDEDEKEYMLKCQTREVALVQSLIHPNIVKVYAAFVSLDGFQYVSFEALPGTMLGLLDKYPKGLLLPQTRMLTEQLFLALDYCHQKGVVHRDVKPENMLVAGSGAQLVLKLCDFGAARYLDGSQDFSLSGSSEGHLTHYVGSRWYRAPELLGSGISYDTSVDVWAAGVLLLEMATGQSPFEGESETEVAEAMVEMLGTMPRDLVERLRSGDVTSSKLEKKTIPSKSLSLYLNQLGEDGVALASRIFKWESRDRVSAADCLQSSFIKGRPEEKLDIKESCDSQIEICASKDTSRDVTSTDEYSYSVEDFQKSSEKASSDSEPKMDIDKTLPPDLLEELGQFRAIVSKWMDLGDSSPDREKEDLLQETVAYFSKGECPMTRNNWLERLRENSSPRQWMHLLLLIQGVIDGVLESRRACCQQWMLSQQQADVTLIECMEHVKSEVGEVTATELEAIRTSLNVLEAAFAAAQSVENSRHGGDQDKDAVDAHLGLEASAYQNGTLSRWLLLVSTLLLDQEADTETKVEGLVMLEQAAGIPSGTLIGNTHGSDLEGALPRPWLLTATAKALLLATRMATKYPERRVALTLSREDALLRTFDLLESVGLLEKNKPQTSNTILCPYYKSSFGKKVVEGFTVEEGEGLGPRKELFSLISTQLTNPWKVVVPQNERLQASGKEGSNKIEVHTAQGLYHIKEGNRLTIKMPKSGHVLNARITMKTSASAVMIDSILSENLKQVEIEISEPQLALLQYQKDLEAYWLGTSHKPEDQEARRQLYLFGVLLGLTVSNQCVLDLRLPDLFFKAILNPDYRPSLEEVKLFNQSLYNSMIQISKLDRESFVSLLDGEDLPRSTSKQEYIRNSLYETIIGTYKWQFSEIQDGLLKILSRSSLGELNLSASDLNIMACGIPDSSDADFDFRSIFQIVMDSDIEVGSPPLAETLWEVIDACTPSQKRKVLVFITGVSKLPAPFTEFLTVEQPFVPLGNDDLKKMMDMLPQSHTCDNILELPNYWKALVKFEGHPRADGTLHKDEERRLRERLKEILKTKLLIAVENSEGYGLDALESNSDERGVRGLLGENTQVSKFDAETLEESESMHIPVLGNDEEESQSMNIPTLEDKLGSSRKHSGNKSENPRTHRSEEDNAYSDEDFDDDFESED